MTYPSLETALETLAKERLGLEALEKAFEGSLGRAFDQVVRHILSSRGRVAVTGVGKSGHIARKIQTSLASTGTPSFFIHPTEAAHGDLGMICEDDSLLAFSTSGETAELSFLLSYVKLRNIPLIAVTSNPASTLARAAKFCLPLPAVTEACPIGLAPSTSCVVQLALGDALMATLLNKRGFTDDDFNQFHPAGRLGAHLRPVGDIMHTGAEMPLGQITTPLSQVILGITQKAFGCMGILDDQDRLVGLVSDGDLRRALAFDLEKTLAGDIMNRRPVTASPTTRVRDVLHLMNRHTPPISNLFIIDEQQHPLGIVHLHDLLRMGVL